MTARSSSRFFEELGLSTRDVGRPSLPARRSDRDVIGAFVGAFVGATDFSRQDLVFVEDMFNGFTDGLAGEAIRGHQVARKSSGSRHVPAARCLLPAVSARQAMGRGEMRHPARTVRSQITDRSSPD